VGLAIWQTDVLFLFAGGKLGGMKLQFSLATLLVCTTVLAVVCAAAVSVPVHETEIRPVLHLYLVPGPHPTDMIETHRPPTASEIATRLAWAGPLSIAATLVALLFIRRLKSRRENGPPVG
jgi:hypothetical protein